MRRGCRAGFRRGSTAGRRGTASVPAGRTRTWPRAGRGPRSPASIAWSRRCCCSRTGVVGALRVRARPGRGRELAVPVGHGREPDEGANAAAPVALGNARDRRGAGGAGAGVPHQARTRRRDATGAGQRRAGSLFGADVERERDVGRLAVLQLHHHRVVARDPGQRRRPGRLAHLRRIRRRLRTSRGHGSFLPAGLGGDRRRQAGQHDHRRPDGAGSPELAPTEPARRSHPPPPVFGVSGIHTVVEGSATPCGVM